MAANCHRSGPERTHLPLVERSTFYTAPLAWPQRILVDPFEAAQPDADRPSHVPAPATVLHSRRLESRLLLAQTVYETDFGA